MTALRKERLQGPSVPRKRRLENMAFAATPTGYLHSLLNGQEGLEITVTEGDLPPVLMQANALLREGDRKGAKAYLESIDFRDLDQRIPVHPIPRTDLMYITAKVLEDAELHEQAVLWYERILSHEPHVEVYIGLAGIYEQYYHFLSRSVFYWKQVCDRLPDDETVRIRCAMKLCQCGRIREAKAVFQDARARCGNNRLQQINIDQMLLWIRHYLSGYDQGYFSASYKAWGHAYESECAPVHPVRFMNDPDPDRPLRVGIITGDIGGNNTPLTVHHAVLKQLHRDCVQLYAYNNSHKDHELSNGWEEVFDVNRPIHRVPALEVIEILLADRIDILLDVGGVCSGSRYEILQYKPAPIMVNIGSLSTTGMTRMDYRLTDKHLDPPGSQRYYTERLVYLAGGNLPYHPPVESPCVGPLPALKNGYVTFGSFNKCDKINEDVIAAWARILRAVPGSRLVLKFQAASDPEVRRFFARAFTTLGIDPDRLVFIGHTTYEEHLILVEQIDLVLDTFPFNGTRTTLEGLWMGVPFVTLTCPTYVGRVGRVILSHMELSAFAADTVDDYVRKARDAAADWPALSAIRQGLREKLLNSTMCNHARYAREMEDAFRWMWRQWCMERTAFTDPCERVNVCSDSDKPKATR